MSMVHLNHTSGVVAQLGERVVRNDEVVGSIPIDSTISKYLRHVAFRRLLLVGFRLWTYPAAARAATGSTEMRSE